MPDLQSELQKTLSSWDSHEQAIRQPAQQASQPKEKAMSQTTPFNPVHNNLSLDIFNCIKAHNGIEGAGVIKTMTKLRYRKASVSSLITQMKRALMVEERDGRLYTLVPEYHPVNRTYNRQRAEKLRKALRRDTQHARKSDTGIAALAPTATPTISSTWDAKTILDNLPIKQARALYDELHAIFGGK